MENNFTELKKIGNKINSLSRKIEESQSLNLQNKTFTYFEELEKCKEKLESLIVEIRKEIS